MVEKFQIRNWLILHQNSSNPNLPYQRLIQIAVEEVEYYKNIKIPFP
jgi:hypothetical protein